MRTVCLCTPVEDPDRFARAQAHFAEMGVGPVDYLHGLHKSTSGLDTDHLYMVDRGPGSKDEGVPYRIGKHPVNIWLGHYMAWQALKLSGDEAWFIVECDAKFQPDWRGYFDHALAAAGHYDPDWDLIYMGSCGAAGRVREYVGFGLGADRRLAIIEGSGPQCNHAYVLRAKAVPVFEEALRKVWAPIDIQQTVECYVHGVDLPRSVPMVRPPARRLNVYTVLPRIVDQWGTEIPA